MSPERQLQADHAGDAGDGALSSAAPASPRIFTLTGRSARLDFHATVGPRMVHRAAVTDVFVTDCARTDVDRFVAAAELPRTHVLHSDAREHRYDLLLLFEVARQAGALVAHRHYRVPFDRVFVQRSVAGDVRDAEALDIGPLPARAVLDVLVREERRRDADLSGFTVDTTINIDGQQCASVRSDLLFLLPMTYRAFRRTGRLRRGLGGVEPNVRAPRGDRAPKASVGRTLDRNVVIGEPTATREPERLRARVVVDTSNPVFFDKPHDHVPPALLFEAYRQTAIRAAGAVGWSPGETTLQSFRADLDGFAELDAPLDCEAVVLWVGRTGRMAVELSLLQGGDRLSTAMIELRRRS